MPVGESLKGQVYIDSDNTLGCSEITFDNPNEPKDKSMVKIALLMRGKCTFVQKARNA